MVKQFMNLLELNMAKQSYHHERKGFFKTYQNLLYSNWHTWNFLCLSFYSNNLKWYSHSLNAFKIGYTEILQVQHLKQERLSLRLYLEYLDFSSSARQ